MEIVSFESAEAFETWLSDQHATSAGIWLTLRKKGAGIVALDYAQALDVALCYGWIDGQKGNSTTSIGCSDSPRASRTAGGPRSTGTRRWP